MWILPRRLQIASECRLSKNACARSVETETGVTGRSCETGGQETYEEIEGEEGTSP